QLALAPLTVAYNAALGRKLYHDNCSFCHAPSGRGDVPAGIEYDPRPPDLNALVPHRSDQELFAAISNGMTTPEVATSPPLGPRWHEFKLYLDEAYRRQLVAYLRATYGSGREPTTPRATEIAHPAYHIVGNPKAAPVKGGKQGGH
ncbi:MAG: c-type cytochrome, partial [Terriglobales bacterium]